MHVAHLIGQKAKAALELADPAFEVPDLGIVVHDVQAPLLGIGVEQYMNTRADATQKCA